MRYVLDTHILVRWIEEPKRLSRNQGRILAKADPANPMFVSDITLWEVASLVETGRVSLDLPVRDWLEQATAPPLVELCRITPALVQETVLLPGTKEWDPADRIIVATTRLRGATLLTSDRRIIDTGLVRTIS